MKKQRIGVFETNSSSMHSLSLGKTKKRVCVVDTKEEVEKIDLESPIIFIPEPRYMTTSVSFCLITLSLPNR